MNIMGNVLDALAGKAYSITSLTQSLLLQPVTPQALGQEAIFAEKGIATYSAMVEYKNGVFTIIPFGVRGTLGTNLSEPGRIVRSFPIPHIPVVSTIQAHEVIGVRKFGSDTEMETMPLKIDEHLANHAQAHEATWEFHRAAAMCGLIKDADGTTLNNVFTEFGLTEDVFTFNFSAGTEADLQLKCMEVKTAIGNAVGGTGIVAVSALIDDTFFTNMMKSAGVRAAFETDYDFRRTNIEAGADVFVWGGITWKRYRANIGTTNFFGGTNVARFYPTGMPGLYNHYMAPANFAETVNTIGIKYYASQMRLPHDMGVQIHSQSNPLFICVRPALLKKGVST
jgi:hypothetical protein